MSQSHLSQRHILRHYGGLKVRDPTPAPPLEGRGAATAGEEFLGQLLYHCQYFFLICLPFSPICVQTNTLSYFS